MINPEKAFSGFKLNNTLKILFLIAFAALYFFTGLNDVYSNKQNDNYAFGADSVKYIHGTDYKRHIIAVALVDFTKEINTSTGIDLIFLTKLKYALFGAANLFIVLLIFQLFFTYFFSLIGTSIYGISTSIWFFSSFPESYLMTAFFAACYIYFLLKHRNKWNLKILLISTFFIILAALNSIDSLVFLLFPIILYIKEVFIKNQTKAYLTAHIFLTLIIVFVTFSVILSALGESTSSYYGGLTKAFITRSFNLREPIYNLLFFNVAVPATELTHSPEPYPTYKGYFEPSFINYFKNPFSLIFIISYLALIAILFLNIHLLKKLPVLAFLGVLLARLLFGILFNPTEAILYSAPINLPLLFVLFYSFFNTRLKNKNLIILIGLLIIFANNLRFFYQYIF